MQPPVQLTHPPVPRVFRYSLDWRFLLPLADPAQIRVAFEEQADFQEALARIGIPVSNRLLAANFAEEAGSSTCSLVLPFGLPVRWVSSRREDQIKFYRSIRQMVCPGGSFLLGFRNSWNSRAGAQYHASTPGRVIAQLSRAGFKSIRVFGVMPNLHIPEYIFELNAPAIHFAVQHRFRRKLVLLKALQLLTRTAGVARLSNFLPCYFALATA